jgi:asparagine synthase (glutamine-hydrolysing)
MAHRGPDDSGLDRIQLPGGEAWLGHSRLSIIDLSSGGHQPMYAEDGRYAIVFNGELYNYRELRSELALLGHVFGTQSDTEVLLAAWAQWHEDCLQRLNGMFAFAVLDREAQTLTLVRDAFGIKPLFYSLGRRSVHFASETPALSALLPAPPQPDLETACAFLATGSYDTGESTFYEGLLQLRPGHLLTVALNSESHPSPRRWWYPAIEERLDLSFEQAAEELRGRFLDSVRMHLRSDVPIGAALSGGVDSSAVVCAMRHLEPGVPIHTFTYVARGAASDEERWADTVNTHVSAQAHKVLVAPQELARDLDDMIRCQGEPFGSTSIYAQYRVFRAAREAGVTVTLDGQGADELLAGYSGYPLAAARSMWERGDWKALANFWRRWPEWPGRSRSQATKILLAALVPQRHEFRLRRLAGVAPIPDWLDTQALRERGCDSGASDRAPLPGIPGRRLAGTLREQLAGRGLAALLRHGDRNSMRWSVESRVPFLTLDLAEFVLQLPENFLLSGHGETKHVFRRAMAGIVPPESLNRRDKIGFETPQSRWLQDLEPQLMGWLDGASSLSFIDADTARRQLRSTLERGHGFDNATWRLINYCRWAQLNGLAVA